jgi:hypothetical protein
MNDAKQALWDEIQAAVAAGTSLEEAVFNVVTTARRQRDSALSRVRELADDIELHRGFWRGGQEELEMAKTDASRAEHRAKTLQKKVRKHEEGRRVSDRQNSRLRSVVETHLKYIEKMQGEGTWIYGQEAHADMVSDLKSALEQQEE